MTGTRTRTFRPRTALFLALAALLLSAPLAAQTVYQWKDANGVTHYSDAPPPKGKYTDRNIRVAEGQPAAPAADDEAPDPKPENAVCAQARLNLTRLQGDAPVGPDADGDGKPDSTLDADARAAQVKLAQDAIRANCPAAG